jgi:hypothetical protein
VVGVVHAAPPLVGEERIGGVIGRSATLAAARRLSLRLRCRHRRSPRGPTETTASLRVRAELCRLWGWSGVEWSGEALGWVKKETRHLFPAHLACAVLEAHRLWVRKGAHLI